MIGGSEQQLEDANILLKEVESVLVSFEKGGKIPNSVIEASIFRKPYFNNKFLPALLKPR